LAVLGAVERATSGRVVVAGQDLVRASDRELARVRRKFGLVFQDLALIPNLSAEDNIGYPLIPRGVAPIQRQRRAADVLERLGLRDKLLVPVRELSGGEQQRVAIARALAGDPEIVLADEPTSNLDQATLAILLDELQQLHVAGRTVIVASHDPQLAPLATQVLKLDAGRLVSQR